MNSFNETDPVSQTCDAGTTPRDPRPMIVKLLEIEAIDPDDRTTLQVEAMVLWQSEIGDLEERFETCSRFLRPAGPADRFLDLLRASGLNDERAAMLATIHKAFAKLGGPKAP